MTKMPAAQIQRPRRSGRGVDAITAAGAANSDELTNSILRVQDSRANQIPVIFGCLHQIVKQRLLFAPHSPGNPQPRPESLGQTAPIADPFFFQFQIQTHSQQKAPCRMGNGFLEFVDLSSGHLH